MMTQYSILWTDKNSTFIDQELGRSYDHAAGKLEGRYEDTEGDVSVISQVWFTGDSRLDKSGGENGVYGNLQGDYWLLTRSGKAVPLRISE
jgi:hypothetical protein